MQGAFVPSIAHIPVPVPKSRIFCGNSVIGAKNSFPFVTSNIMACSISSRFCSVSSFGIGYRPWRYCSNPRSDPRFSFHVGDKGAEERCFQQRRVTRKHMPCGIAAHSDSCARIRSTQPRSTLLATARHNRLVRTHRIPLSPVGQVLSHCPGGLRSREHSAAHYPLGSGCVCARDL
jgi:hypothetical protein